MKVSPQASMKVEFDQVLASLLASIAEKPPREINPREIPSYYRSMRTVGIYAPRQIGKTRWVLTEIIKRPQALGIIRGARELHAAQEELKKIAPMDHERCAGRLTTAAGLNKRLEAPEASTWIKQFKYFYVDDALSSFHYVEYALYAALLEARHFDPYIIRIG